MSALNPVNSRKVAVLGAGLVGKAIAIDLATDFKVTSFDISAEALRNLEPHGIRTHKGDLKNVSELRNFLEPFDLVIGAVPGFFQMMPPNFGDTMISGLRTEPSSASRIGRLTQ